MNRRVRLMLKIREESFDKLRTSGIRVEIVHENPFMLPVEAFLGS